MRKRFFSEIKGLYDEYSMFGYIHIYGNYGRRPVLKIFQTGNPKPKTLNLNPKS